MENSVRATINPPSGYTDNDVRYQTECQFALEPSISGLMDKAEAAGWDRRQAAFAVIALASTLVEDCFEQRGPFAAPLHRIGQ